jgi:hypothetical protein
LASVSHVATNVDMGGGFLALMRELKLSMYTIARQAELRDEDALESIQAWAEQSMRLIDSYILSAQSEYGQQQLRLEPLAIGSVMHEAAHSLRGTSRSIIQANANHPVMTHREALYGMLSSAGQVVAEAAKNEVIFRSYITSGGDIGVGVFAEDLDLSTKDLKACLQMSGKAHMPLARHSSRSGVMLVIADSLAKALGGSLEVKRMGRLRGLATILPRSEQLALV